MSGRTYLSIGDVLTLLRREFPDVTISKIRFLESQGLVNPERTPSGYRKFYEQDVERLRWVLRQQREHFLPLKVIKGRLDEETSTEEGNGRETLVSQQRPQVRHPSSSSGAEEGRAHGFSAPVLVGGTARAAGGAGDGAEEPALASGSRAHVHAPGTERNRGEIGTSESFAPRTIGQELPGLSGQRTALHEVPVDSPEITAPEEPSISLVARAAEVVEAKTQGASTPSAPATSEMARKPTSAPAMGAFSGTSMTIEELAAASDLRPDDVRQLESYGLIAGRSIGGIGFFDEDALIVVRLASAFARFGVEARHLRLHLLAAQREAGFIEQVVLPLLKQRNPASRQRAQETVAELSRLGQDLRSALLQARLHDQLGG